MKKHFQTLSLRYSCEENLRDLLEEAVYMNSTLKPSPWRSCVWRE